MMDPATRRGRPPANAGKRYPAEPLTASEVNRLLAKCGRGAAGLRNRALIVVMWRCGLRVSEALALETRDLDLEVGTITVRHGKGNKRRVVGIDPQAQAVVARWLDERSRLLGPLRRGAVFCTISRHSLGHPVAAPYVREMLKALAVKAGIEKRVHPHGLRHTHAVELMREGVPVPMIQRQLGHNDLATTARYLDHLSPQEVIDRMQARTWGQKTAAAPAGVIPGQITVDELLAS